MAEDYKAALSRSRKAARSLEMRSRGNWLRVLRVAVARSVTSRPWPRKK